MAWMAFFRDYVRCFSSLQGVCIIVPFFLSRKFRFTLGETILRVACFFRRLKFVLSWKILNYLRDAAVLLDGARS